MALRERLDAFEELLRLSGPRVDPGVLAGARDVLDRADERRRLPPDHTVVALAGATGSGKSSLFNALCGQDLSAAGVRRPMTTAAVACAWDPEGAPGLLDRLRVPGRLRFTAQGSPAGLVLLDLPDHDSVDRGHRAQVDRLIGLVDVVVWVLDPEKYADASLHERYLRPLAGHADVMLVVLNQIDRLPEDAVPLCMSDLRRLLDEDGLAVGDHGEEGTQVLGVSVLTGEGMDDFRAALAQVVRERGSSDRRIRADLDRAASELRPVYVGHGPTGLDEAARGRFLAGLEDAVDAPGAVKAAERDYVCATADACAPPYEVLFRSRAGLRPVSEDGAEPRVPWPVVLRPLVEQAVRDLVRETAAGLPAPWADGVRQAAERGGHELAGTAGRTDRAPGDRGAAREANGELARALSAVNGGATPVPGQGAGAMAVRRPGWTLTAAVVQWLFLAAAVVGVVSLAALLTGLWTWPWWSSAGLLAGGLSAGPGLARLCREAARRPARRHADGVERAVRYVIEKKATERVLGPVEAELRRYRAVRERFGEAAGD